MLRKMYVCSGVSRSKSPMACATPMSAAVPVLAADIASTGLNKTNNRS